MHSHTSHGASMASPLESGVSFSILPDGAEAAETTFGLAHGSLLRVQTVFLRSAAKLSLAGEIGDPTRMPEDALNLQPGEQLPD